MSASFDLTKIGFVDRKYGDFATKVTKDNNKHQEFAKLLTNKKSDYINQRANQSTKFHQADNVQKLALLGKAIVSKFQRNILSNHQQDKDLVESESDLVGQITGIAELINQLTQKIQSLISNQDSQELLTTENVSGLENDTADFNDLLGELNNIGENFPLLQELLANLSLIDKNQINNTQLIQTDTSEAVLGDKEITLMNDITRLLSDTQNIDLSKALTKLEGNFNELINTTALLSSKDNSNFNLQGIKGDLENIISMLAPKFDLLATVPSVIIFNKDHIEGLKQESDQDSGLEELKTIDEQDPVAILKSDKLSLETSDTVKNSENNSNKAVSKEFVKLFEKQDLTENNVVAKEQDIPVQLINNQSLNKQQLNMQEMQNIFKTQFVATKESRENVIGQIVQKATLMVKEGFSEMKMQLKPDALGKVDLQISVERGIVTAKFAAENQQVKELIEANLSNLKQNLSNQGIKIDQISVAVGNQQNFNEHSKRPNQQANSKSAKKYNIEDGESYGSILSSELQSVTKEWYSENTVDYTA